MTLTLSAQSLWSRSVHGCGTLLPCLVRVASRAHTLKVGIAVVMSATDVVNLCAHRSPAMGAQPTSRITSKDAWAYHPVPVRGQGYRTPLSRGSLACVRHMPSVEPHVLIPGEVSG